MIKNNLPLIHGLIDAILLLESSGPDEINPDTAVRGMENIASSLLALQPSDQVALRKELEQIASEAQDHAYRNFVKELPDMIGLATE
ncbi:MAG: hypothetical protein HS116_00635 [Planctomycetes bacterium]|nr:hypothetical protein [Planctomycetota bacterium]